MINEKIKQELEDLYIDRIRLVDEINEKIKIKSKELEDTCDHKDKKGDYTIEYNSRYEMRSSDMYCTQCNKQGGREELLNQY